MPEHNIKRKSGRLKIGDDWNAIMIIALSQNNPLKAIAEFVENSIDAQAKNIVIVRGKEKGLQYLKIIDDGQGIPCTTEGVPDFQYVATHICDSLKRRLKEEGASHLQGEFGIGLLSFWTVGNRLTMISSGANGKSYQMVMDKNKPGYTITSRPHLIAQRGTQLMIAPLLPGIRLLAGEKIQRYLASELRDRIRISGAKIRIVDRTGRAEFDVEPRQYDGGLIHDLPQITTPWGDLYTELYLDEKSAENRVSLFRSGTRVFPDLTVLDAFQGAPWDSGYFQGIIDAPFLSITPGTRDGIIQDDRFASFCEAISPIKERLAAIALEQTKAEDERMSKNILRSVQKAFRDAMYVLPDEDYDWFGVQCKGARPGQSSGNTAVPYQENAFVVDDVTENKGDRQKQFFEVAGPLFSARISPGSAIVQAGGIKSFRAVGLDKRKRQVEGQLTFTWNLPDGGGVLECTDGEIVTFKAPQEPCLTRLCLNVKQDDVVACAEAVVTIVETLEKNQNEAAASGRGLPVYTLESAAGQLWRSRYDEKRNVIVINSGHRDFIYASRDKIRKLRYICRLFAKELVYLNFPGMPADQLLERLVELSLYAEENLR